MPVETLHTRGFPGATCSREKEVRDRTDGVALQRIQTPRA